MRLWIKGLGIRNQGMTLDIPDNLNLTEIVVEGFAIFKIDHSFGGGWGVTKTTEVTETCEYQCHELVQALTYVSAQVSKGVTG